MRALHETSRSQADEAETSMIETSPTAIYCMLKATLECIQSIDFPVETSCSSDSSKEAAYLMFQPMSSPSTTTSVLYIMDLLPVDPKHVKGCAQSYKCGARCIP